MKAVLTALILLVTITWYSCESEVAQQQPASDPEMMSFLPLSGGKGTTLTILGKSFGTDPAAISLKINNLTATIQTISDTRITATVPAKCGLGALELSVRGKTLKSSEKFRYLYSGTSSYFTGGEKGFANGPAAGVKFEGPYNIVYDSKGIIYVADLGNCLIRKIEPDGTTSTVVGFATQAGFQDGKGDQGMMHFPIGLDIGLDGVIYVADAFNSAIRKVSADGNLTTIAGSPNRVGTADGSLTEAQFQKPYGVKMDKTGVLWICDTENALIRKISKDGQVSTYAGSTKGFADGSLRSAKFNYPAHLTFDDDDNVFLADKHNHCIRKISKDGQVTTFAGKPGQNGWSDGKSTDAMFDQPSNVQIDKLGNLYVTDLYNHCIRLVYPDGAVTTLAGQPTKFGYMEGEGNKASFYHPQGCTLDKNGDLYITDSFNSRIRKLTIQ